jgi:ribosomal small subunit protein bTHX
MGRGDKKTAKGKRAIGSHGNSRPKKTTAPTTPKSKVKAETTAEKKPAAKKVAAPKTAEKKTTVKKETTEKKVAAPKKPAAKKSEE